MALGGMQYVGRNGLKNEGHPLIDNGFMYTTERLGPRVTRSTRAQLPKQGRVSYWIAKFPWRQRPGQRSRASPRASRWWEDL